MLSLVYFRACICRCRYACDRACTDVVRSVLSNACISVRVNGKEMIRFDKLSLNTKVTLSLSKVLRQNGFGSCLLNYFYDPYLFKLFVDSNMIYTKL